MSSDCETPTISFKRGDDLKLDFTTQDTNNTEAIALLAVLTAAEEALTEAENAEPYVQADVDTAQAAVDAAQAAYDAFIIVDITGWTITCQLRRGGKLIDDLDITIIDATLGTFSITKDNTFTSLWPIASIECDIEFVRTTGKVSSETFIIEVLRDITR